MIKVQNVGFKVSDFTILKDINFEVEKNDIVVLVGVNGSGKSTLIKCLASSINYSGDILIDDIPIKSLKNKKRSTIVSYLPQNCLRTNIKVKTLVKHSRFPYLNFGDKLSKVDKDAIKNAINLTKIDDILEKNVYDISGGERQLAYLTLVLAQDTPIVLLDEPNTFLDIHHQIFLFDIINKLKENGKTVILVLHDLIQALEIADKIILIEDGKVKDFGSVSDSNIISSIEKSFNIKIKKSNDDSQLYQYCLVKK